MSCLISVIIPAFNASEFLPNAIDSALKQTNVELEIVVVDDGSTDITQDLMKRYSDNCKIHYLKKKNNEGLSSARNYGILKAKGNFTALLDADDIWTSDKLFKQLNVMKQHKNIGMVYTDFDNFDSRGILSTRRISHNIENNPTLRLKSLLLKNNFIYPSTALIRNEVFEECGFFDINLKSIEDYDMWLKIISKFKIIGINETLTKIRIHDLNMSKNIRVMLENEIKVVSKYKSAINFFEFNKRIAKIYFLNSDRLIELDRKNVAFRLFCVGFFKYPFLIVDITIIFIKLILGAKRLKKIRNKINNNKLTILSFFYKTLYKKY